MQSLPKEVIEKTREAVGGCKPKLQVAKEFGICCVTVEKYTRDLPRRKIYSIEEKERIWEMVREIGVKSIVARELGIPYNVVIRLTQDIKFGRGKNVIGGKTLRLLEDIIKEGYAFLEGNKTPNYRILKKYFPVIQRIRAKGKSIVFLPDRKKEVVRFFLQTMQSRVMSYHELKSITRLFRVTLSPGEKQKLIGKSEQPKTPKIQRKLDRLSIMVGLKEKKEDRGGRSYG